MWEAVQLTSKAQGPRRAPSEDSAVLQEETGQTTELLGGGGMFLVLL